MTHHDVFLADIIEHPEDDTPRLIYADWLDEHGEEARSEFIRVQVEMEKDRQRRIQGKHAPKGFERAKLERRGRGLFGEIGPDDLTILGILNPRCETFIGPLPWSWQYRRGFVDQVTLSSEDFLSHADALVKAAPLTDVTLTTLPIESVESVPGMLEWRPMLSLGGLGYYHPSREYALAAAKMLLVDRWPRITFHLPETPSV